MGRVTSLFARKVVGAVDGPHDRGALLGILGLTEGESTDPSAMIPAEDYYRFFESAAAVDAEPVSLPLRVGASMRADEYGAFGLAWKSAPTLRESLDRLVRYGLVLTSVAGYEFEETFNGGFFHLLRRGERRLGMRLSNEANLASVVAMGRQVSSERFNPRAVYFSHSAPETVAHHESFFECPVHFGSEHDALLVSQTSLRTPNKLGDESISAFFDMHLSDEVGRLDHTVTLDVLVRDHVATALSGGVPAISAVARHLGTSARTLQRRLSQEGHTYQSLVDDARRKLATRLVGRGHISLSEVAYMTGFSDQSSFTRAFKRWAGQTPRSYRLEARRS